MQIGIQCIEKRYLKLASYFSEKYKVNFYDIIIIKYSYQYYQVVIRLCPRSLVEMLCQQFRLYVTYENTLKHINNLKFYIVKI